MFNQNLKQNNSNPEFSDCQEYIQKGILSPFQEKLLQGKLKTNLRPEYRRRIEIMLLADRGQSQTEICAILNCSHETARYWTHIAQTGEAHKWKELPIGRPKTVNEKYLNRLQDLVSQSPRDFGYAFRRWTANWLSKHLAQELGIEVSERHVNRLLKQMGLSTRPLRCASQGQNLSHLNQAIEQEQEQKQSNTSNIVIRNLNANSTPKSVNFSPFHLS
jgi:transposase